MQSNCYKGLKGSKLGPLSATAEVVNSDQFPLTDQFVLSKTFIALRYPVGRIQLESFAESRTIIISVATSASNPIFIAHLQNSFTALNNPIGAGSIPPPAVLRGQGSYLLTSSRLSEEDAKTRLLISIPALLLINIEWRSTRHFVISWSHNPVAVTTSPRVSSPLWTLKPRLLCRQENSSADRLAGFPLEVV